MKTFYGSRVEHPKLSVFAETSRRSSMNMLRSHRFYKRLHFDIALDHVAGYPFIFRFDPLMGMRRLHEISFAKLDQRRFERHI